MFFLSTRKKKSRSILRQKKDNRGPSRAAWFDSAFCRRIEVRLGPLMTAVHREGTPMIRDDESQVCVRATSVPWKNLTGFMDGIRLRGKFTRSRRRATRLSVHSPPQNLHITNSETLDARSSGIRGARCSQGRRCPEEQRCSDLRLESSGESRRFIRANAALARRRLFLRFK